MTRFGSPGSAILCPNTSRPRGLEFTALGTAVLIFSTTLTYPSWGRPLGLGCAFDLALIHRLARYGTARKPTDWRIFCLRWPRWVESAGLAGRHCLKFFRSLRLGFLLPAPQRLLMLWHCR